MFLFEFMVGSVTAGRHWLPKREGRERFMRISGGHSKANSGVGRTAGGTDRTDSTRTGNQNSVHTKVTPALIGPIQCFVPLPLRTRTPSITSYRSVTAFR